MLNCAHVFLSEKIQACTTSRRGYLGTPYSFQARFFDPAANVAERVELCRCPDGMAKANGMAIALSEDGNTSVPRAVYVIGVRGDKATKIGVSSAPMRRWQELQSNHYRELFLFAALYMVSNRKCETIEAAAIERSALVGDWRRGEWVGIEPEKAFDIVVQVADDMKIKSCDPGTWVSNLNDRTRALVRSKRGRIAA